MNQPTPDVEIGTEPEDNSLDFGRIAELLSELSQSCPMPSDAVPQDEPTPFQPDEVDFRTNDWLSRLLSVQAWVRLDAVLSPDSEPLGIAAALFAQLGSKEPGECYTAEEGGNISPTATGIQLLEDRLSLASQHRQAFADALEDERSADDASTAWVENWEEYEAPPRPPISINAEVAQWRIKDFKENANEGLLDLNPSYQRDIVWSNPESQMLIESILRGIPLPSVILSQTEGESGHWQIVDGKQRLTAILRFIGQHPDGRAYAKNVGDLRLFDENFRKFARKHHLKPADIHEKFLPFKLKTFKPDDPLTNLSSKYYCEIKSEKLIIGGRTTTIREAFESIGSGYMMPVLLYRNTKIHDIHHVFGLYNKQGKKLNAEELRNAVYHHVQLMRLLLVLSGDRPIPDELAPYLPAELRVGIRELGGLLRDYNFGTSRFKRTKVLSWVSAILLEKPNEVAGQLVTPSTASHINAMLTTSGGLRAPHPMVRDSGLTEFARVVESAIRLHWDCENAWSPIFRNKKGNASKWEELPLVGSLLACVVLVAAGKDRMLKDQWEAVRALSESLRSPDKTQNKTQWKQIAKVTTQIIDKLQVDRAQAGAALENRYGYNCLPVLERLAA